MDKRRLIDEEFIARYSSHCRGSTLDCTLVDMTTGREKDMGSPFDFFSERSYTAFRGIITEWWHFTLEEEPYPDTYFDFPVSMESLR